MDQHPICTGLILCVGPTYAGYTINIDDQNSITFGGYIKVDARYVDGNVAYQDFWTGGGTVLSKDVSGLKMFANESRFNMKMVHGDVTGFIEMDFYGGGGNQIISNSSHPRLRHAMISFDKFVIGQTWSTFMNLSSLVETVDFAGPLVAQPFVRNTQVRYSNNGFSIALENPESFGNDMIDSTADADPANDDMPDIVAKYQFDGDWGNISIAGLARQLTFDDGDNETALGVSVAGRIKTVGKDDLRFALSTGELGRYVGVTAATDVYNGQVEKSTSVVVAYRHFWQSDLRSSVFYGYTETDESDRERSHYGINLFKDYTDRLSFGFEVGNYDIADSDADSWYSQASAKFVL